jgi:ATP-dependent exoDNAse (exonuclease V) alpha subunit
LKKNAQVIFIKNDATQRWVNGTIAKIDFISTDILEIRLQNGEVHKLEPVIWENRIYKYDKDKRRIVSEVVGTFTQYPIKLAWAITIHKSQGLSFDQVVIDLGSGAFVNGQLYTALSRCRTLQGINLKRRLKSADIIADQRIINYYETQKIIENITIE